MTSYGSTSLLAKQTYKLQQQQQIQSESAPLLFADDEHSIETASILGAEDEDYYLSRRRKSKGIDDLVLEGASSSNEEDEDEDINEKYEEIKVGGVMQYYPTLKKNDAESSYFGDDDCCPKCCTLFSLFGIIFMLYIGFYASFSICYMHNCWSEEEIFTVQKNAFGSCGIYFLSFIISIYAWGKKVAEREVKRKSKALSKVKRDLRD